MFHKVVGFVVSVIIIFAPLKKKIKNMKKLTYLLLVFAVAISSCKKDDKINNAQDFVKKLQKGVWQYDRETYDGTTHAMESFIALKFESDHTFKIYYSRTESTDIMYYRIKEVDGDYKFSTYETKTRYDNDGISLSATIKYNDNELTIIDGSHISVYKYYSSMDKTKDLPRGSL